MPLSVETSLLADAPEAEDLDGIPTPTTTATVVATTMRRTNTLI
jgi:hypothetical protein